MAVRCQSAPEARKGASRLDGARARAAGFFAVLALSSLMAVANVLPGAIAEGLEGPGSLIDWRQVLEGCGNPGPNDLKAHLELAVAYANLGMIPEATRQFQVIEAAGYQEFGAEVIRENERTIMANPRDIMGLNRLAFAYYAFCDYQKSVECFGRLVKLDARNPWVHHYLALGLSKVGRLDSAIEVLKTAAAIDPPNEYTHLLLGLAYKEKGWYVLSILELAKARRALRELSVFLK